MRFIRVLTFDNFPKFFFVTGKQEPWFSVLIDLVGVTFFLIIFNFLYIFLPTDLSFSYPFSSFLASHFPIKFLAPILTSN